MKFLDKMKISSSKALTTFILTVMGKAMTTAQSEKNRIP